MSEREPKDQVSFKTRIHGDFFTVHVDALTESEYPIAVRAWVHQKEGVDRTSIGAIIAESVNMALQDRVK